VKPTTGSIQKPVFVYGTLRAGQGNYHHILLGTTSNERPAVLHGHTLLGLGVPFATPRDGKIVVGEVMDVRPELWAGVLRRLDYLEGYQGPGRDNTYVREVREVVLDEGGTVEAYVYLAGSMGPWIDGAPEVPGGDWVAAWKR